MNKDRVQSIQTPIELSYTFVAGIARTRFLDGMRRREIVGQRCSVCQQVYINARGTCPSDGSPLLVDVPVGDKGTLLSWCIVNVPFTGQSIKIPYICGMLVLDDADAWFLHLVDEVEDRDLKEGMRLEAVWQPDQQLGPTFESIKYFRPTDEPTVKDAYQQYLNRRPSRHA